MASSADQNKSARNILTVPVRKFDSEAAEIIGEEQDFLAVEEPLQIRAGDRDLAVTMRTPGNDVELAAGFLFTEGLIRGAGDLADIQCDATGNPSVILTEGASIDLHNANRNSYI